MVLDLRSMTHSWILSKLSKRDGHTYEQMCCTNLVSMMCSETEGCLVCAFYPIMTPGLMFGFMPIRPICPHVDEHALFAVFKKCQVQSKLGKLWLFLMVSASFCYMWVICGTRDSHQLIHIAETVNCLNATCMLLSTIGKVDIIVAELNGLSEIFNNHKTYSLYTASTERYIRRVSLIAVIITYSLYAAMVADQLTQKFELNIGQTLNLISMAVGGITLSTIFNQSWIKMLLMLKIFRALNLKMKKKLNRKREDLNKDVLEMTRVHLVMVRNYQEASRFWSPAILSTQLFTCANLVIACYLMVINFIETSVDRTAIFHLLERMGSLITAAILSHVTQQYLEDTVSIFL